MKNENYAVITGDIRQFTLLGNSERKNLIEKTEILLKSWVAKPTDAEIFRGDSYQLILDDIQLTLFRSVQLICWFIKNSPVKSKVNLSTKIAVGIGTIAYKGKTVLDSDGIAFHESGRYFDKMGDDQRLVIRTSNEELNQQIEIILTYINLILCQWTVSQARVLFLTIEGYNQDKTAVELGVVQSTVNGRLKAANWKEVEKGLLYIAKLITN